MPKKSEKGKGDKAKDAKAGKQTEEKKDAKEEFQHRVRVSGVILDGNLSISNALTRIKGIGHQISGPAINVIGVDANTKLGTLNDKEIEKVENIIENLDKHLPGWMLNARRDNETGKDIHLIGSDLTMKNRDDINIQKSIRSYRGIRHGQGLPVRGQRTRTSFRKGVTLGVQRKKRG